MSHDDKGPGANQPAASPGRGDADVILALRRAPVQARGHATFLRILDTTAQLLEEVGLDRLTTNLIASRAHINIATLYKYFPNKLAVINALFQHQLQQRAEYSRSVTLRLAGPSDWRAVIDTIIDTLCAARRQQPAYMALRRAMASLPELRRIHEEVNREAALGLAEIIASHKLVTGVAAEVAARCAIEMLGALLDLADGEPEPDQPRMVQEAKRAMKAYMAHCFER